jgi:hypothetical protein
MGGKVSAPPAPNYGPIAQADANAASQQFQLGQQQLQWGQQQFNTVWPYAQQYLQQQTAAGAASTANAQNMQNFYNTTYQPIESQFANEASTYNSPARANANSAAAQADVANSFTANRNAAQQSLESYGIDPSQTRFGALDLGSRIAQSAATAAAGTQSRMNTEAVGLGLQGEAINTGRGYAGNVAQAYSTATNAGSAGINAANATTNSGVNAMGSPTSYMGLGNQALNNQANTLNMGFQNSLAGAQFNNQVSQNQMGGIGQLIGGALGFAGGMGYL